MTLPRSEAMKLTTAPHRRLNPLTGEWVLVSPQRAQRPWQGKVETATVAPLVQYDPGCYLCPGNKRAKGETNPTYERVFVFENDFSALKPDITEVSATDSGNELLVAKSERGLCKVVCFSPQHDLTISQMPVDHIQTIVETWASEYSAIGSLPWINYVQIFENRGEIMGCSNPHPHGQIWANQTVPTEPVKEQNSQLEYQNKNHHCLLCDYLASEERSGERIVCQNESFVAVVPFWAVWPFETLVLSRRHTSDIAALDERQRAGLAGIMQQVTRKYDHLFEASFPYTMGFHQRPTDGREHPEWHLHAHYYPPLLRSATVRKFMVGYEMLAMPQRDLTAEQAAERLRQASSLS
jgi:UDPglucose--hexose-1-phosphate uridylyltransferase